MQGYAGRMSDTNRQQPWNIGGLPPALAVHVPVGERVAVFDYYEGPFQEFEEAVTADMGWDVAPSLAILPQVAGDIVELCAGAGRLTAPLAAVARSLTAIERSPSAAARLRERFAADPAVRVVGGDLADYRAPADADVVGLLGLSIHVLPWSVVERAITLAAECLRPGGSFCVNVMADGIADRLGSQDGLVRRRRYRDRGGVERTMMTATRFHRASRMLDQYWLVSSDGGTAVACMRSYFWAVEQVTDALARAGFRINQRVGTRIDGGAGQGAGVVFLRAGKHEGSG